MVRDAATDSVARLTETVLSWKNELARANEIRAVVQEIKRSHDDMMKKLDEANVPGLATEVGRMSTKLDMIVNFLGYLMQREQIDLDDFQKMAKEKLGVAAGDIFAARDANVTVKSE